MTQNDRVLKYSLDFGSISTLQAFNDLGVTRLASRIHDLRMAGYNIKKRMKSSINRYGDTVNFAVYYWEEA